VALVIATDNQSTASLMIAWAGSGWLAAAVGLAQGGIRPRFPHAISWLREQRDLTFRYFGEFVISSGATQLSVFLVGALATLADVGRLRAGQIILGPLNVLFQGAGLVAVAETSRLLANSPGKLDHAIFGISGVLAAGSLAWAVIALMVPSSVGQALMGGNWAGGQALLVPLTISILGYALAYGPMTGLRALAAAPASLRARIFDSTALLLMSTVGAATAGATGVAWGHAVMGCLRVPNWWWHFRKARREYSAPRAEDPTGG
jgi:O-antigen/teichoic acid export membrane protein